MTTELVELLREALPFVDTCPDLVRPGGDELAERITRALASRAAVPDGFVLVPMEPTDHMLLSLMNQWDSTGNRTMEQNYAAMLAAAPEPGAVG